MTEENRFQGTRKTVYRRGDVSVTRVPEDVDSFRIYKCGTADDDEEDHSASHCEGSGPIDGMKEWASWYCINKKDDGTIEAELDEAWWWGGGHNDGGTMCEEVPEEWLDLPYDGLLENLVTLVRARHYGFTAEHLRRKKGLREFLGYRRRLFPACSLPASLRPDVLEPLCPGSPGIGILAERQAFHPMRSSSFRRCDDASRSAGRCQKGLRCAGSPCGGRALPGGHRREAAPDGREDGLAYRLQPLRAGYLSVG